MTIQAHRFRIGLFVAITLLAAVVGVLIVTQMVLPFHVLTGIFGGGGPAMAINCPTVTLICP